MKSKLNVFDCLCFNLRKTSRLLTQYYDEALRPSGLRITQFTLMAALGEMGEVAFVPLSGFLGMDRTTLARNVEVLERDGWVQVQPGVDDRRQQRVRLTDEGRKRLLAAMPLWESAQREAIGLIGLQESKALRVRLTELSSIELSKVDLAIEK